jgi:peptide methionine sulfoxide reductase MsrA
VQPVAAEEPSPAAAAQQEQAAASTAGPAITPVYFGNGCFWGRQFDYVNAEKALGRDAASMSAVAGYAGGATPARAGKVCYYRGPSGSVYEELGHAEVVGVNLEGQAADAQAQQQYRKFAETYFKQVGAGAGAPAGGCGCG